MQPSAPNATRPKALIVDDEPVNIAILEDYLSENGYDIHSETGGEGAMDYLKDHPDTDVILLDRMMPGMDGMETLSHIRQNDALKNIPVIMQTAAAAREQVLEGINAGVFHYLTKPFEKNILLSLVRNAVEEKQYKKELTRVVNSSHMSLGMMRKSVFDVRTLSEAKNLSYFLARVYPNPERVVMGIVEMIINGIEHGNLGIGYREKKELLINGKWEEEIERRSKLPENAHKHVTVTFERTNYDFKLHVQDCGEGFDWKQYLEISPQRAIDPNGRGIAMARMMSFDEVCYLNNGTMASCSVML